MSDKLSEDIKHEIEQKAQQYFEAMPDILPYIAWRSGATEYAEKWQAAIARAERAEKALREICGEGGQLIPAKHDMIAIAREALTPKQAGDE